MSGPADEMPDDASEFEASVEPLWDRKPWRKKFIDTLSTTGNTTLSCKEAGISRWTAYKDRQSDQPFRLAWERAMREAGDLLEQIAFRRATGYKRTKQKFEVRDDGTKVLVEEIVEDAVSDQVLMLLLRAAKPEKYRENLRVEHGGIGGEPIKIEPVRVRTPERLAELLEIARDLQIDTGLPVIEHRQLDSGANGSNGEEP